MSTGGTLPIQRRDDGIVVLHLTPNPGKPRGGVVVLDAWLIAAIDASLQSIDAMQPKGFLLVSDSERVFVAGADLAEIDSLDDSALHAYLRAGSTAFRRISSLPCPSACVIHRAALGGGLELAMHCDALFGVTPPPGDKGWKIGLPECGLNICPGWGGTVLLPARIEPAAAIGATMHGAPFDAAQPPRGLLESLSPDATSAQAAAIAWLLSHPRTSRRSEPHNACEPSRIAATRQAIPFVRPQAANAASIAVIDAVQAGCAGGFDAAVEREQLHLVDLRHTPEARRKLDTFLKR
jgi:3-hydroxyacyl-CoA dehydrogenase/enoyl-CoA hydratase/3-hydroxybutyryl-CoA epimerase